MSSHSPSDARPKAIDLLKSLGLSTYAARTFVALVSLGEGTAQDVSDVSEVPRTRVYDAVEELQSQGLVDVRQASPKTFWAISAETTRRLFSQEYHHRFDELTTALDTLEPEEQTEEQRGVWTVTNRENVQQRIIEFVDAAEEEVVFMTVKELLTDEVVSHLREASDRGVSIRLGAMSESVSERLGDDLPEATVFDSLWTWSDTPAGRLLMVDQRKTLVSVLRSDGPDRPATGREETAIWGSGEDNSLVVVLRAMFTWQLDRGRSGR